VRQAIHAAPLDVTGPWTICSDRILYTSDAGSMLPIHKQLTRERGAWQLLL
jgi:serine carboxypeptidase-like clade 1